MPTLSVILITRNEEANLADCLASLEGLAQQIVVVDTNSSDRTLEIAKTYGAVISQPADWPGFGPQKNRALELATEEWVLSLDADERLTPALRSEILTAIHHSANVNCFAIPRLSWFCGRFIRHSGWTPDYVDRLFKRGSARFSDDLVHERLIPNGEVAKLQNPLLHFSFMNMTQVKEKMERYSSDSAKQAFLKGRKGSPMQAFFHGLWAFIRTYIVRLGFLDGPQGISLAVANAQGSYYRYIKLWRLNQAAQPNQNSPKEDFKISVIVATYNWPEALKLCLLSLIKQTDSNFEIIVADDGSGAPTKAVVDQIAAQSAIRIEHVWQEDDGCRKTLIANRGIAASQGSYLIFIDGDCIAQPDFVSQHRKLAQKNYLITGSRILLSERLTKQLLQLGLWNFSDFKKNILSYRMAGDINKVLQLIVKRGDGHWRNFKRFVWRRIKGCNMACWKSDALAIGGFDESLVGWAHEDADFVFRLEHHGIHRKSGSWSTEVIHLYHRVRDQSLNDVSIEKLNAKIRKMRGLT
jgi:glycosyltransferase involved in cell wall biosynthesis